MTKHVIKNAAGSEPVIEWSMEVEDGDLEIYANGIMVMFLDGGSGKFMRVSCSQIDGVEQGINGKVIVL